MKKPIIALIILLIIAGGSVGALMAVKNKQNKEKQHKAADVADNKLFSFDPYSVTKIVFSKGDEVYTAEKNDDLWKLDNEEFKLDKT